MPPAKPMILAFCLTVGTVFGCAAVGLVMLVHLADAVYHNTAVLNQPLAIVVLSVLGIVFVAVTTWILWMTKQAGWWKQ